MRLALFALLTITLTAVGQVPKDKPDLSFDGRYTIVSGEKDGRPIPDDKLVGKTIRIEKDRIVGVDANGKEFLDATFTVDGSRTPALLKVKSTLPTAGESTGLIEKKTDTVRLIYAVPNGPPPSDFKTQAMQMMFTLRAAPAR